MCCRVGRWVLIREEHALTSDLSLSGIANLRDPFQAHHPPKQKSSERAADSFKGEREQGRKEGRKEEE
jgi:hypothetical protein